MPNKIQQSINKSQEESFFIDFIARVCTFSRTQPTSSTSHFTKELKSKFRQSNTELLGAILESLPKERGVYEETGFENDSQLRYAKFADGYNSALSEIKQILNSCKESLTNEK